MRLNKNTSEIVQTHYQLIAQEYDGETFSHDKEITEVAKGSDSMKSNVIFLAQTLITNGVAIYTRQVMKRKVIKHTNGIRVSLGLSGPFTCMR